MATRTKPAPEPEEYDFDSWTEDDETAALAALKPDIKHIIVEKNFIGRFPDGVIVKMPLSLSLDDADALQEDAANPVDQFKTLLKRVGGDDVAAEFSKHDLAETVVMADRYFTVFSKISQASFPES